VTELFILTKLPRIFMPNMVVGVINASSVVQDNEVFETVKALQVQVSEHLAPSWGVDASLHFIPRNLTPPNDVWWLVILDDSDQAGALGYHDLTEGGLPLGKVFVHSDMINGESWTVTASHELLEMLVDPDISRTCFVQNSINDGRLYSVEICDPCESDQYGYTIGGVLVSDFIFPSWFESFQLPGTTQFDATQQITKPFEITPGGYIGIYDVVSGGGWQQTWTSMASKRLVRAAVGSRRERRRLPREQWLRSNLHVS
jgi:hypothetical protein